MLAYVYYAKVPRLVPLHPPDKTTEASELVNVDDTVLSGAVLLHAKDWNYPLPDSVAHLGEPIPSFREYFDCIVENRWTFQKVAMAYEITLPSILATIHFTLTRSGRKSSRNKSAKSIDSFSLTF
jgi:hypothetical protein